MIITITPNPFVTRIAIVKEFDILQKITPKGFFIQPGGGGVHVSTTVSKLGGKTLAYGFVAGISGFELLLLLEKNGISNSFVKTEGETRNVFVVIQENKGVVLRVRGPSPSIQGNNKLELLAKIKNDISQFQMMVISGSLPDGIDEHFLADLISIAKSSMIPTIVDTKYDKLDFILAQNPNFIKLSLSDFVKTTSENLLSYSIEDTIRLLRQIMVGSNARLIFSMGSKGALLLEPQNSWHFTCPKTTEVKPDGAGDVLIGAFSHYFFKTRELIYSLKCGISAATQSVRRELFCDVNESEILSDLNNIIVTQYHT